MKRLVLLVVIGLALMAVSAAAGYRVAKRVNVKPGGSALFLPHGWFCNNRGQRVDCQSGDARPWAELTGTSRGGVTVRVHTLDGGGVRVRTIHHPAMQDLRAYNEIVYTFSAF